MSLDDRPCIIIESKPYCYLHAKNTVKSLRLQHKQEEQQYKDKEELFEKQLAEWNRRKELEANPSGSWDSSDILWLALVLGLVGCAVYEGVGALVGSFGGVLLGVHFRGVQRMKFEESFNAKNPRPAGSELARPKPFDEDTLVTFDLEPV